MAHMNPLDLVINAISGAAFLGFLTFIVIYAIQSNWRATNAGRSLMYAIGALNLVVLLNTIHLFTGPYPGIQFVRIPVYVTLVVAAWHLVYTLVRTLKNGEVVILSPTKHEDR